MRMHIRQGRARRDELPSRRGTLQAHASNALRLMCELDHGEMNLGENPEARAFRTRILILASGF